MACNCAVIKAGETFTVPDVPANAAIGVMPGDGGSMKVQYRISLNGPLRDWASGTVQTSTSDVTIARSKQVVFTATGADGMAEWNW